MSLLDDARRLVESNVAENFDKECGFCGMSPSLHDVEGWTYRADNLGALHYPECPWLAMPRIVAALEAADRLIDRGGDEDRAEWIALAEALDFPMQGEKVTA